MLEIVRRLRRFRHDAGGQATLEFAFVLPILLILFAGVFEFSRHYYTRLTIRNAVTEAARFASTGREITDEDTGETLTRRDAIIRTMVRGADGFDLDIDRIELDPEDGGGPDDVVSVRVTYQYAYMDIPLLSSLLPPYAEFTVATTFKNEPVF
jgi:hypothetical protein